MALNYRLLAGQADSLRGPGADLCIPEGVRYPAAALLLRILHFATLAAQSRPGGASLLYNSTTWVGGVYV